MIIREAKPADKNVILEFCKNTFSWGDYIKDVWNYWLDEGNLFVIDVEKPVGMCHAFFSNNQVWLEGIRIEDSARRKGLASKLISHIESLAIKNKLDLAFMLIDIENMASLLMAKNLDYKIHETWKFYSLLPKPSENYNVKFGNVHETSLISHYVRSWRWIKLDKKAIRRLSDDNRLVYSNQEKNTSLAILTDSEHFKKTLIVTLHSGCEKNTLNLISYLQDFGFKNNYERIQILTKEDLPKLEHLEPRISFHLMKKPLN